MLRKSLFAAGMIAALACLTACGSGNKQTETAAETTTQETAVAQEQTTAAEEKVITDKNSTNKDTVKETTTKAPEKETTTKAPEKETTTKAPEQETTTKAPEAPQAQNNNTADTVYYDDYSVEEEAYGGYYGVIAADGDGLTLRDGPDSSYEDLTLIPDGTEIEILDVMDGWGYINYGGMEGWVSLDYVQ